MTVSRDFTPQFFDNLTLYGATESLIDSTYSAYRFVLQQSAMFFRDYPFKSNLRPRFNACPTWQFFWKKLNTAVKYL